MQVPSLTLTAFLFFATAQAQPTENPSGFVDVASQYGPLGIIALALGAFAFWQEKRRDVRDEKARLERLEYMNSLKEVLERKEVIIKEKDDFIMNLVHKK